MRKRDLLAMPELNVTEEMMQAAENDRPEIMERYYGKEECYKHYYFLRAVKSGGILKVSVFARIKKQDGIKGPLFDIYIDKENEKWIVFDRKKGTWRGADLYNLLLGYDYRTYGRRSNEIWCAEAELLMEYLETNETDAGKAIRKAQETWRKKRLEEKDRKTLEKWDAQMAKIPAIPEDFEDWVQDTGFLQHQYIFYQAGKTRKEKECFCTVCRNWYTEEAEKVKHNTTGTCPVCRRTAKYKGYNKQKRLKDRLMIGLLQKTEDEYVMRYFECTLRRGWQDYREPELSVYENERAILGKDMRRKRTYVMANYKQRGHMRWCETSQGGYYYRQSCVQYMNNLEETLGEKTRGIDLWSALKGDVGISVDAERILHTVLKDACIEYVQKAGLHTIENELLDTEGFQREYDVSANTLSGFLKIDKQRINRLREIDGNVWAVKALRHEENTGDRVSKDHLLFINQERINVCGLHMDETGMSLCRTINYLKKQSEINHMRFHEVLRFYGDYLNMAKQRGMDITDEIVCHQREMKKYHDYYVRENEKKKNRKRDSEVDQKFQGITAEFEKNCQHFAWKNKKYVITVPKYAHEITEEGRLQHHCVGASDAYLRKMEDGKSYILFLRRSEEPETPYYTLEVTWDGGVLQAYGAYDRKPEWEDVEPALKSFTAKVKKWVGKEAMIAVAG